MADVVHEPSLGSLLVPVPLPDDNILMKTRAATPTVRWHICLFGRRNASRNSTGVFWSRLGVCVKTPCLRDGARLRGLTGSIIARPVLFPEIISLNLLDNFAPENLSHLVNVVGYLLRVHLGLKGRRVHRRCPVAAVAITAKVPLWEVPGAFRRLLISHCGRGFPVRTLLGLGPRDLASQLGHGLTALRPLFVHKPLGASSASN